MTETYCGFLGCPGRAELNIVVGMESPIDRLPEERPLPVCAEHAAAVAVTTERNLHTLEAQR